MAPHSLRIIGLAGPACELAEQRREALALESAVDRGDLPAECSRASVNARLTFVKRPVWRAFTVTATPPAGAGVLLDDRRLSGWTIAMVGGQLRRAGAEAVVPLTLATLM